MQPYRQCPGHDWPRVCTFYQTKPYLISNDDINIVHLVCHKIHSTQKKTGPRGGRSAVRHTLAGCTRILLDAVVRTTNEGRHEQSNRGMLLNTNWPFALDRRILLLDGLQRRGEVVNALLHFDGLSLLSRGEGGILEVTRGPCCHMIRLYSHILDYLLIYKVFGGIW